jgi:hypothetical protein
LRVARSAVGRYRGDGGTSGMAVDEDAAALLLSERGCGGGVALEAAQECAMYRACAAEVEVHGVASGGTGRRYPGEAAIAVARECRAVSMQGGWNAPGKSPRRCSCQWI